MHHKNGIHKDFEKYNPNKKCKILIVFYNTIVDITEDKKLNLVVTHLFIRGRKLNISFVLITQSYLAVPKNIRLNFTHYFIMKIPNKWELQQVAFNHSSDIDFKDFINLYKKCIVQLYSFLVINAALASDTLVSERIF